VTHRLPLRGAAAGGERTLVLGERTLLMGIVNATPDSFSDGGLFLDPAAAVAHAARLVEDGADLLDVGGESTRPGAAEVPEEEQLRRLLLVVEGVRERFPALPISVDTRSARVARESVAAGADLVNDVSGLAHDPAMRATVAELGVPAVVMHMRGTPADMRGRAEYGDVVAEVVVELRAALDAARAAGVEHLLADPGLGFAKTAEQSATLLSATDRLVRELGVPLLVGPSRKSFLALATGRADADRTGATVGAATVAALLGAHVLRVHDVAACRDAVRLADLAREARRARASPKAP